MRKALICVLCCALLSSCGTAQKEARTRDIFAMDTLMNLKVYDGDDEALTLAEEEINRIDKLLDRGKSESEIYRINTEKNALVSDETAALIKKSLDVSKKTDGAFDITVAPLMDLWGFYTKDFRRPTEEEIAEVIKSVGYDKIEINENRVTIPENTAIDLGGIAKGYTSDRVSALLREHGVTSAIISLGGNVYAIGKKIDGTDWTVGITNPVSPSEIIATVKVCDKAVITSGGYQRYFEWDGKVYHHILNPRTGTSAESGLASVTIISPDGTDADALSTSLFVMGLDNASKFWRENKNFDAVFVDSEDKLYITEGIADSFQSDFEYTVIR